MRAHSSGGSNRRVTSSVTSSAQCDTKLCIAAKKNKKGHDLTLKILIITMDI